MTMEEIKASRRKKPQQQEQVFCYCGRGMEGLADWSKRATLARADPVAYCFYFDQNEADIQDYMEHAKQFADNAFCCTTC